MEYTTRNQDEKRTSTKYLTWIKKEQKIHRGAKKFSFCKDVCARRSKLATTFFLRTFKKKGQMIM